MKLIEKIALHIPVLKRHLGLGTYEEIFIEYVDRGVNRLSKAQRSVLLNGIQQDSEGRKYFALPAVWTNEIWTMVGELSPYLRNTRTRSTTQELVSEQILNSNLSDETVDDLTFNHDALLQYDQKFIKQIFYRKNGKLPKLFRGISKIDRSKQIKLDIIRHIAAQISNAADKMIFSEDKEYAESSIRQHPSALIESVNQNTESGHVVIEDMDSDRNIAMTIQRLVAHIPFQIKQNFTWYMNKETALWLGGVVMHQEAGRVVYLDPDYENRTAKNLPMETMYSKPVIIIPTITGYKDSKFPVVGARLDLGYTWIHHPFILFQLNDYIQEEGLIHYHFSFKMNGRVYRPIAIKYVKMPEPIKPIDTSNDLVTYI